MKTILIIDDEEKICWSLEQFLKDEGYNPIIAHNAGVGLRKVKTEKPDLVILDVRLPDMNGLEALKQIKSLNPSTQVIIITAYDFFETTIKAMQLDAFDFIAKPPDLDEMKKIIDKAIKAQELSKEVEPPEIEPAEKYQLDKLVGQSSQMQELYKLIGAITTNNVNVLIEGESGTGKELVAKAIHYNGPRQNKPFVPVNCGALPDALLESELFGYEKGAFTGADSSKKGRFEIADGGTLFLDEVSTMSPALQVKLLRVLEEREFEYLGGTETIKVDVRIIAATNENLETLTQSGTFREDLYYRLKVISFNIPPLRERPVDIPLLVNHFLAAANINLGKQLKGVDNKAMELLLKYDWPGNVRELGNAIKRAAVLSRSGIILVEHLPPKILAGPRKTERTASALETALENTLKAKVKQAVNKDSDNLYDDITRMVDKSLIRLVLQEFNENQVKAAQMLGISRTTLREKIKKLEI